MRSRFESQIWNLKFAFVAVIVFFGVARGVLGAEPTTLTSGDGRIQIQVPDRYGERTPSKKEIAILAVNTADETTVLVISDRQSQFDSLAAYAELVRQRMTDKMKDFQANAGEKLELNGNPAIRYEITGISPGGLRMAFQVTIIQTATRFNQVIASSLRTRFADFKEEFAKVAASLKELPAKKTVP